VAEQLRVAVEVGPKGKKTVAVASDWPGLERGGKTEEHAVERMLAYVPRYAPVAERAGLADAFARQDGHEIVTRYPGTGSTDFWGISFAFSDHDHLPVSTGELDRELALVRAAWDLFDGVRARVSPVLRKGPRGGGRDRDQIIRHVLGVEADWASGIGVTTTMEELLDPAGVERYRSAYLAAIRQHHADGLMAKKWPLRYLVRHTAYHTLDHTWEMEDKDLTGEGGSGRAD
jgi:hypothetical protein